MRVLLDTHTFIWFYQNDPQLSRVAREYLEVVADELYLSMASAWELAIKIGRGKLELLPSFEAVLARAQDEGGLRLLQISLEHTKLISQLPFHHRDPFDRMIIAQAKHENLTIVSRDIVFDQYDITRVW